MSKNILLVDDEYVNNVIHKSILEKNMNFGYIESVIDGRQAMEFLNKSVTEKRPLPDYIFLDINMPIMNGFEFLTELSNQFTPDQRQFKVIMLSSSIDPRDQQKAQTLGADGFHNKPLGRPDIERIFPYSSFQ